MAKDYYQILGISRDADASKIKKAYRELARKHHPDIDNSSNAEERFKEINEAYQVLSDPQKRQAYDQFGSAAFEPGSSQGQAYSNWQEAPGGFSFRTYSWGSQGPTFDFDATGFSDPFDIFEIFFGSRSPFGQAERLLRYILPLEFIEAVKGVQKEVEVSGRKIKVKVPAGVDDGSEIKFKDFVLICQVKGDDYFKRQGYDLFTEEKIHFTQAILGDTIPVKTVDGFVEIRVPAGTQSHTQIRLKGRGVPHIRSNGRGDQYVKIVINMPNKVTAEEKKHLEALRLLKEAGLK